MGTFRVTVQGVGDHGCQRTAGDGETVIGCERAGCVDCITREYVRRLKRANVFAHGGDAVARLEHWPTVDIQSTSGSVVDDLLTGTRKGSF